MTWYVTFEQTGGERHVDQRKRCKDVHLLLMRLLEPPAVAADQCFQRLHVKDPPKAHTSPAGAVNGQLSTCLWICQSKTNSAVTETHTVCFTCIPFL